MSDVIYNEHDKFAAQWLRNLINAGHLPTGHVDARGIQELKGSDCAENTHLFAGIGGWPLALRLAGWPESRPVWTGSCPCQPFSSAGKRKKESDERHLWPEMFRLIGECRPATVFGEQVASKDGLEWLAGVRADLETMGYAVGAADLPAASVGAPHMRQRIFWVATTIARVGNANLSGFQGKSWVGFVETEPNDSIEHCRSSAFGFGRMVHAHSERRNGIKALLRGKTEKRTTKEASEVAGGSGFSGPWADCEIIGFKDGKSRRIEPGIVPLVDGVPYMVERLRGYGNSIIPQVAAEFIRAFMDC